jgi:hypothetical protein
MLPQEQMDMIQKLRNRGMFPPALEGGVKQNAAPAAIPEKTPAPKQEPTRGTSKSYWPSDLIQGYILAGISPPFVILGMGFVVRWIARGFRQE